MKHILSLLVLLLHVFCASGQRADTFDVYFERDEAKVQPKAQAYISKLIADNAIVQGQKIMLLGYADYLGSSGHNDSLSVARARSVERHLLRQGFSEKDISLCVGKGKIDRAPAGNDGYSTDRKVQIIAMKKAKASPFDFEIEMVNVAGKEPGFAIGKYPITQAQWRAVMGTNPSAFKGCDSCPVETISMSSIMVFLHKLDSLTGKQYRLPTEAEWEYAANGGSKGHGYYFAGSNDMNEVGWHAGNSGDRTHPVGQKSQTNWVSMICRATYGSGVITRQTRQNIPCGFAVVPSSSDLPIAVLLITVWRCRYLAVLLWDSGWPIRFSRECSYTLFFLKQALNSGYFYVILRRIRHR